MLKMKLLFFCAILYVIQQPLPAVALPPAIFAIQTPTASPVECQINIQLNNPKDPLVLNDNYEFVYPESSTSLISIKQNDKIYIGCSDREKLTANKMTLQNGFYTCNSQTNFTINTTNIDFNDITCDVSRDDIKKFLVVEKPTSKSKCLVKFDEYKIGYKLPDNTFITTIIVCFDKNNNSPVYSKYRLTKYINNGQTIKEDRPDFFENSDVYDNWDLTTLYTYSQQKSSISTISNLTLSNSAFWNRGHLTANADFVYRFQRYTTFDYLNIAPQWKSFNSGNWNTLEQAIRKIIESETITDVDVYTGTFGVANVTNNELHLSDNLGNRVPVPRWFWKCISLGTLKDYVFLGYNNLLGKPIDAEYEIENNICKSLSKITEILSGTIFTSNNLDGSGLMYACKKSDLKDNKFATIIKGLK